jgi:SAM-dependent methyltransferase
MNENSIEIIGDIKTNFSQEHLTQLDQKYSTSIMDVLQKVNSEKIITDEKNRILDAGCGKRSILSFFDGIENFSVVGCDIISDIKESSFDYDELAVASIENLPFKENSFNVVIATFLIEHLTNPYNAFAEIFYAMKPGGFFVFVTPNLLNYTIQIANISKKNSFIHRSLRYMVLGKTRYYDNPPVYYKCNLGHKLEKTLTDTGFNKIELSYVGNASFYFKHIPVIHAISKIGDRITNRIGRNLKSVLLGVFQKPDTT